MVSEESRTGVVKPLPRTVFQHTEAEQAFRFMVSGKHIGKIVLKIRNEAQLLKPVLPKLYFDPFEAFNVVRGLGGFGLELADWLVQKGVRSLVLISRSGVMNGYQRLQLSRWRSIGVKLLIFGMDLNTVEGGGNSESDSTVRPQSLDHLEKFRSEDIGHGRSEAREEASLSLAQLGADTLVLAELRQVLGRNGHPGISYNEIRLTSPHMGSD